MIETEHSRLSAEGRVVESDAASLLDPHIHRYQFALSWIRSGDRVLDCACGSGYGTNILRQQTDAESVVGLDISELALDYCRRQYRSPQLTFQFGSAEDLQFADGTFDRYVSFETIEHVPHPELMLKEAARVLKPGGLFLVSTPNRVASGLTSGQKPHNPFHMVEWSLKELDSILRPHFTNVRYYGQRIRSKSKLRLPYLASKIKQLRKQPDIHTLRATDSLFDRLETDQTWYPDIYIAVCETK